MAKTNTMTRKDALVNALDFIGLNDTDETMEDTCEILRNMLAQLNKQAERKAAAPTKTQARRDNEIIAKEIADMVETGDRINGAWIQNHSPYHNGEFVVTSFQKATSVMAVAGDWDKKGNGLGLFTKVMDGKELWYERL